MTNNDRIDLYLTDRMPASERASFEREMAEDSALAQEVALQRELVRAIQSKGAKEYLQQVEKIFSAGKKDSAYSKFMHPQSPLLRACWWEYFSKPT